MSKKYPKKPTRKSDTSSFRDIFNDLLKTYDLEQKFDEKRLIASWDNLMGKPIADRTTKLYIKEKKLFVKLNSAPLRHELSLSKDKIKELFRNEYGHDIVQDIVFI